MRRAGIRNWRTWAPQPCHVGRGAKARRVSVGRGQERSSLSTPFGANSGAGACARQSWLSKSCGDMEIRANHWIPTSPQLRLRRRNVTSNLPAIRRPFLANSGDCAEEFLLLVLPPVCFETGRFTLTQSSWTVAPTLVLSRNSKPETRNVVSSLCRWANCLSPLFLNTCFQQPAASFVPIAYRQLPIANCPFPIS